jgi:hypothetical protein
MAVAGLPTIEAPLKFMKPGPEKPRVIMSADHTKPNERIGEFELVEVPIADARALADTPNLDREGFALVRSATAVADFYDEAQVRDIYYPEVRRLLQAEAGASEVVIFDHTLRVEDDSERRAHATRLPVFAVHNDYTEWSGPSRARELLGAEKAERFLSGRWALINVWRSFGASADRFPLAAADGRTVPQADFIGVEMVYPDRKGEIYQNAWSPGQRWYWYSGMQRDEAMLLKCFDSSRDGRTRYTAHSGFANPHAPPGTPPRASIEVRTIVAFADT